MILSETIREALQSLWTAKQRSLLALLGIVIGIGSVIAMVSVGEIVQYESLRQFREMGTDILQITAQSRGTRQGSFKLADALQLMGESPAIIQTAPYANVYGKAKIGGETLMVSALGVTNAFFSLNKTRLARGRILSDFDEMALYCVIGTRVATELRKAGVGEVVGHKLQFNGRLFTIVGEVAEMAPNMMRPHEINEGMLIPVSTALRLGGASIAIIQAKILPDVDWRLAKAEAETFFISRDESLQLSVRSAEELRDKIQNQMQLFTLLLGAVGGISLVVGGVGVMNVMLVSVSERKREIGIRRALGAQRRDIQVQFLIESICLCLVGGLLGLGLGIAASWIIASLNGWGFFVSWIAAILGVSVSCIAGLFFGFYPARQAAHLKPIEALRES